jgi:hypothetical protein
MFIPIVEQRLASAERIAKLPAPVVEIKQVVLSPRARGRCLGARARRRAVSDPPDVAIRATAR